MLLNEIACDPALRTVSAVVVDEVHERSINTDLVVAMLRRTLWLRAKEGRHPLRLVLTSATMNEALFAAYFARHQWDAASPADTSWCPVMAVRGRTFPVEIVYRAAGRPDHYENAAVEKVQEVDKELPSGGPGENQDVLVFVTQADEAKRAARALSQALPHCLCLPLYGSQDSEDQKLVFQPTDPQRHRRKVVVATNVAETSVTIDGIGAVIDTGMAKQPSYDKAKDATVLCVDLIAQSSARQRAGRAGRTAPGKCYRLYSREEFEDMQPDTTAELLKTDTTGAILTVIRQLQRQPEWVSDVRRFPFVQDLGPERLERALHLLFHLGALEAEQNARLTPRGMAMARMPQHPRNSAVLFKAQELGVAPFACVVVAALEGGFLLRRERGDDEGRVFAAAYPWLGDVGTAVAVWVRAQDVEERGLRQWCDQQHVHWDTLKCYRSAVWGLTRDAAGLPKAEGLEGPALQKRVGEELRAVCGVGFGDEGVAARLRQALVSGYFSNVALKVQAPRPEAPPLYFLPVNWGSCRPRLPSICSGPTPRSASSRRWWRTVRALALQLPRVGAGRGPAGELQGVGRVPAVPGRHPGQPGGGRGGVRRGPAAVHRAQGRQDPRAPPAVSGEGWAGPGGGAGAAAGLRAQHARGDVRPGGQAEADRRVGQERAAARGAPRVRAGARVAGPWGAGPGGGGERGRVPRGPAEPARVHLREVRAEPGPAAARLGEAMASLDAVPQAFASLTQRRTQVVTQAELAPLLQRAFCAEKRGMSYEDFVGAVERRRSAGGPSLQAASRPQLMAATAYTLERPAFYKKLNLFLRTQDVARCHEYEPFTSALMGFMEVMAHHEDADRVRTLHRGSSLSDRDLAKLRAPQAMTVWTAFTSVSESHYVALRFMQSADVSEGQRRVLFEISSAFGCSMGPVSLFDGEAEVLLPAYSAFAVESVDDIDDPVLPHVRICLTHKADSNQIPVEAAGTGLVASGPAATGLTGSSEVSDAAEAADVLLRLFADQDVNADVEVMSTATGNRLWGRCWFSTSEIAAAAQRKLNGHVLGDHELSVRMAPVGTEGFGLRAKVRVMLTGVEHMGTVLVAARTLEQAQALKALASAEGRLVLGQGVAVRLGPWSPQKGAPADPLKFLVSNVPQAYTERMLQHELARLCPCLPPDAVKRLHRDKQKVEEEHRALGQQSVAQQCQRMMYVSSMAGAHVLDKAVWRRRPGAAGRSSCFGWTRPSTPARWPGGSTGSATATSGCASSRTPTARGSS